MIYDFWSAVNLIQYLCIGHFIPNGAKFLRLGHDPSQNMIKIWQVVTLYIRYKNPENFSLEIDLQS